MASVISYDFPERHVRDFLYSSKIYYDASIASEQQGSAANELVKKENKTPWRINLIFDQKKITSKEPWSQIVAQI